MASKDEGPLVTDSKNITDKDSVIDEVLTPIRRPFAELKNNQLFIHSQSTIPRNKVSKIYYMKQNAEDSPLISKTKKSMDALFTPPPNWENKRYNFVLSNSPSKLQFVNNATVSHISTPTSSSLRDVQVRKESKTDTPVQTYRYNPFDNQVEKLQVPTVSPSLFREVISPSKNNNDEFKWSLDQMARLHPAFIEVSPRHLTEYPVDPDYEKRAQEAIDKFFSSSSIVPSPWTGNINQPSIFGAIETSKSTVWCQTELSLPPTLPPDVEKILMPFYSFKQSQNNQSNEESEDSSSQLNSTALRRKLLFADNEQSDSTQDSASNSQTNLEVTLNSEDKDGRKSSIILKKDDAELPWCDSEIVSISPNQKRFYGSPGEWNLSSICQMDESSPIKTQGSSPVSSSPNISPIKFDMARISPIMWPNKEAQDYSLEKDMSQESIGPICQENEYEQCDNNLCCDICGENQLQDCRCKESERIDSVRYFSIFKPRNETSLNLMTGKDDGIVSDLDTPLSHPPVCRSNKFSPTSIGTPSSAQFSSSPIKGSNSSCIMNQSDAFTPNKLSTSPPLSPIRCHSTVSHMKNINRQNSPSVSLAFMEESTTDNRSFSLIGHDSNMTIGAPSTVIMDTDSQPYIEASFTNEGSSQDTGYQTHSTLGPLSQSSTDQTNIKVAYERIYESNCS